ncbi:MAG: Rrf2 family transcriptional regulator [Ruminococcaceae bacterium]|nr:Rrf2 family transcriptional regulator [Oscillospiraceae bacterium]
MRITLESDYALRIISALALNQDVIDAASLSEKTSITPRFTLKILHKLVQGNLVTSYKGSKGGYKLKKTPDKITLKEVIELIDGPIAIVRCLGNGESCALNTDKTACIYHHIFDKISIELASKLQNITISDVLDKKYTV